MVGRNELAYAVAVTLQAIVLNPAGDTFSAHADAARLLPAADGLGGYCLDGNDV